jgi:hypothetical protein
MTTKAVLRAEMTRLSATIENLGKIDDSIGRWTEKRDRSKDSEIKGCYHTLIVYGGQISKIIHQENFNEIVEELNSEAEKLESSE